MNVNNGPISPEVVSEMGIQFTYAAPGSTFISRHHMNYRFRALEQATKPRPDDFSFTCPVTLSEDDAKKIRQYLRNAFDDILKMVTKSPEEKLICINLDFFELASKRG